MEASANRSAGRMLMAITAFAAWFAVGLQLPLSIKVSLGNGLSVVSALVTYFSFFTILTNLLVASVLTVALFAPRSRWGNWASSPSVLAATALYITTVGLTYSLLLRHTWNPEGLNKLTDIILHDVVPVLFVGFWLFFAPKSGLRWRDPWYWTIYPVTYLAWVLVRGEFVRRYPYPFVDVGLLGYPRALGNAVGLFVLFLVAAWILVGVCRWLSRNPLQSA